MKHFTLKEFIKSPTADCLGIDNTPGAAEVDAICALVEKVLDPLREQFANPIYVNSGYRCRELNVAVGGSKSSQHLRGEAADITAGNKDANARLWRLLRKMRLPVDQAINEHGGAWIHVSYSLRNRREYFNL